MNIKHVCSISLSAMGVLSSLATATLPPGAISLFQAVQQPAPPPGTPLNVTSEVIKFTVPGTDTIITFSNWAKLLYQTDVQLCLLEGMGDLANLALRAEKGDKPIPGGKFRRSYGKATVSLESYSPPAFRLTLSVLVDTLRGLGLFMSLYGYQEVDVDIHHRKLGHVGIGVVQY